MRNLIFFLILILNLTGCVRGTLTTVPGLSGVVVDGNTGKPLENVEINNEIPASSDGQFSLAATTKRSGSYWLQAIEDMLLAISFFKKRAIETQHAHVKPLLFMPKKRRPQQSPW